MTTFIMENPLGIDHDRERLEIMRGNKSFQEMELIILCIALNVDEFLLDKMIEARSTYMGAMYDSILSLTKSGKIQKREGVLIILYDDNQRKERDWIINESSSNPHIKYFCCKSEDSISDLVNGDIRKDDLVSLLPTLGDKRRNEYGIEIPYSPLFLMQNNMGEKVT